MISEGEKWARIVIFIIVGAYSFVVVFLTIRFLIRTCCYEQEDERTRWQHIIAEEEARRLRLRAEESPPPPFLAALKCPLPRTKSFLEDSPPPSYEDVCTIPVPVVTTSGSRRGSRSNGTAAAEGACTCQCQQQQPSSLTNSGIFGSFDFEGVTVVHL